jgi:hypothetical protein
VLISALLHHEIQSGCEIASENGYIFKLKYTIPFCFIKPCNFQIAVFWVVTLLQSRTTRNESSSPREPQVLHFVTRYFFFLRRGVVGPLQNSRSGGSPLVICPRPLVNIFAVTLSRYSAGLRAGRSGFDSRQGAGNFSLRHRVQTSSGAHPASYPMGTRGCFPGGKEAEAWSWPLTSI